MSAVLDRLGSALADRYAIQGEAGRGGMASVLIARDLRHDRTVALKVFDAGDSSAADRERFLREIRLSAQLQHPHIMPLYDSGQIEGLLWFVMPFVGHESLRERLEAGGPLPVAEALRLASEVADALAYAHERGVVHRDIKPDNILLTDDHALLSDFGIADALSQTMVERITETGMTVGTPQYMSPEQASGDQVVDARSDIYSLGVVLYEMLVGEPPFTGPNVQALMARRFTTPAPRPSATRDTITRDVDILVARALARMPGDRYESADEMLAALRGAITSLEARQPGNQPWSLARVGAVAVLPVVVIAVLLALFLRGGPELEADRVVVFPFRVGEDAAELPITGAQSELLLHEALGRWEGVRLVDELRAADARVQSGGEPATVSEAIAQATQLRAGMFVWGELRAVAGQISVRAALYDVKTRQAESEHTVRLAADLGDAAERFGELAEALLVRRPETRSAADGGTGTRSLTALRAYERGHRLMTDWQLADAREEFLEAARADPSYPQAHLWVAQISLWLGRPIAEIGPPAARALAFREKLSLRDAQLSDALSAIAEQRFPDACAQFEELIARDQLDFAAWYGLGECHRLDRLVVADRASPSGWRFRGSAEMAARSYARALHIVPSSHLAFAGHAHERLEQLLHTYTEFRVLRLGASAPPGEQHFGAYASLRGDTLAFIPYPLEEVLAGGGGPFEREVELAVARNRGRLLAVTRGWITAFPRSVAAAEALARALEAAGQLTGRNPDESAIAALSRARTLATNDTALARLDLHGVRMHLKAGNFVMARALADSVRMREAMLGDHAEGLAAVAALTGRPSRIPVHLAGTGVGTVHYLSSGDLIRLPSGVADAWRRLLTFSALGVHADSVRALDAGVRALLAGHAAPEDRETIAGELLSLPLSLAYPHAGPGSVHRMSTPMQHTVTLQAALSRGDRAAAAAALAELRRRRIGRRAADFSLDENFTEAWLLLAMGDTASAVTLLDHTLESLPEHGATLLTVIPAAMVVRSMILRAEIAARQRDATTAARWAGHVALLWNEAEPPLRHTRDRMRELAATRR